MPIIRGGADIGISNANATYSIPNIMGIVLGLIIASVVYLYYTVFSKTASAPGTQQIIIRQSASEPALDNIYTPPLNTIDVRGPIQPIGQVSGIPLTYDDGSSSARAGLVPVNIRTSSGNTSYQQIGILTKNVRDGRGGDPVILPLMGRNLLNGRDKWQYYTMANSGGMTFNAKLPVSVNGRSCTGEYGCDRVYNGDTVYVEGYEDTFRATIYENATMNYIPL